MGVKFKQGVGEIIHMSEPARHNLDFSRREYDERRQSNLRSLFYALFKSRRRLQRRNEAAITYNDYYEPVLLLLALALMLLCVLDAYFTLILIQLGSTELNPIMAWALNQHVMVFFLLKYGITAGCVVLTVIHRNFRIFGLRGIHFMVGFLVVYICLIQYQLSMLFPYLF